MADTATIVSRDVIERGSEGKDQVGEEAIARLTLFIHKVERLQSLSLVRTLLEGGSSFSISWTADSGAVDLAVTGPDAEQIDAFVLTMRLFIQNNDQISLHNMARLYEGLPISERLKQNFTMHRGHLNESLQRRCILSINEDNPTMGEVLETILYGQLSHLDPDKRQRYLTWAQFPMAGSIIHFEFVGVLMQFVRTLVALAANARCALAELEGTQQGSAGGPPRGE